MVELKIKTRPVGATAVLERHGHPQVTSETGGALAVVTGASDIGFNPLDLMFSSLAACLALSARIAASKLGMLDRLTEVRVHVTGEKSHAEPFRVVRFVVDFDIEGDFSADEKAAIAHMAEDICTVSNTMKADPAFTIGVG